MADLFDVKERRHASWKDRIIIGIFVLIASALFAGQTMAFDIDLFGKPLTVKGYVNQSVQFGVAGDSYATYQGFQQGLMQALLELEYYPVNDVKIFVTGMFSQDWAYPIYDSDDDWSSDPGKPTLEGPIYSKDPGRRFFESRSEMALRDDYEDVLKECHVTWTPASFNFRVGKQIVAWGRMDGVRILDQINPKDNRLGPSDVEFESSIIPIWLAKAEYYPSYVPPFLDELGLEFTFNPNADFIGDKNPASGGDVHGIWASDQTTVLPAFLGGSKRIMSLITNYEEPDSWNSDGYEYAFRIKGTLPDSTYFTLNYFNGVENAPVIASYDPAPGVQKGEIWLGAGYIPNFMLPMYGTRYFDDKGNQHMHPYMTGKYADKEYAGFSFARDFESLYINALGGVAPLIRVECIYEFDSTFTHNYNVGGIPMTSFTEHDAIFGGFAIDWKFKWNLLNPRRYFSLMPQFSYRHIRDYPNGSREYLQTAGGATVSENNYEIFCMLRTQYMHDKLTPSIVYMRTIWDDVQHIIDGSAKADMWLFNLAYEPNHIWSYKMRLTLMDNDGQDDYRGMDDKDNISFTVQYQF